MAPAAVLPVLSDDEDLSDEQVRALLQDAERRLRDQAQTQLVPSQRHTAANFKLPSLMHGDIDKPYVHSDGKVARVDQSRLVDHADRALSNQARRVEDPIVAKRKQLEEQKATSGPQWFDMPRTDLTPELKRDLQLLKMRSVLDPHRHYKKENGKAAAPEFSQVGTIIEGNTEFFSARINNKDRKRTFVEEALATEANSGRFKRKYEEIQLSKTSGRKAFYKALKAKRGSKVEKR